MPRKLKRKKYQVGVLMPVYNEEKTLKKILTKIVNLPFVDEVIAVNDCSTDKSLKILKSIKSKKLKYFSLSKNSGKTAAIKFACQKAGSDILIIQDADLEYDPDEIPLVLEPIFLDKADVVYGSRFLVRKATRVLYFYHYIANKTLTFLSNLLTNLNMTDIETCYKAFRRPILVNLPLQSHGFGMEVEITALVSKLPIRIYEVPISYYGRTYQEGKKISTKDGILAIYYTLYFNLIAPHLPKYRRYLQKTIKELNLK